MANDEQGRNETQSAGASLSAKKYRGGLSASFLLWGCILILFFGLGKVDVWVKRDDLIALAQTTAAVASIAIAVLAYLHDVGNKDRFFRLFLAALTFVLLLGTITGWLAALTMKPPVPTSAEPEFTGLALRFLVIGSICFCTGVSDGLVAWRGARWPMLRVPIDYSFFFSPLVVFAAFAIWPANASLAGITLALSIGSITYLICFLVVLFFFVWREKSYNELVVERVLETLRTIRADDVAGQRAPATVNVGELTSILRSNDATLTKALDALVDDDRIFQIDRGRYYYVLESDDWDRCIGALQQFDVVIFGNDEKRAAEELAKTLHLPSELVMSHLLPDALRKKYIPISDTGGSPVYLNPRVVKPTDIASILADAKQHSNPRIMRSSVEQEDNWIGLQIRTRFKCLPNDSTLHEIVAACKQFGTTNP